jgi:hypothetical protein
MITGNSISFILSARSILVLKVHSWQTKCAAQLIVKILTQESEKKPVKLGYLNSQ